MRFAGDERSAEGPEPRQVDFVRLRAAGAVELRKRKRRE
jgi:hypothetical protein